MSKIITIVVAIAVVGAGSYYYFNSGKNDDAMVVQPVAQNDPTPVATAPANGKKLAFSEFIKQGGSYKCTVHQNVGGTETEGTTYIDGNMVRGEYHTQVQGMKMDSTMIVRDGYTYSWTSMAPGMGFKVKAVENSGAGSTADASGSYNFNASQIGDYNCEPWTVDASKFTIPTSVTFKEIVAPKSN